MSSEALNLYTYSVYGVHCSQCLKTLKGLTQTTPGLDEIVFDMSQQRLKAFVSSEFSPSYFSQATKNLGFEIREIKIDESLLQASNKQRNSLLAKVGISGALMGNIMLLSYAVYLGAPDRFYHFFTILSGILYLPVLFYSATPFYTSSWTSIKARKPSIDLPLTVAIIFGSGFSYFNLIQGNESIYFDSLAALVFLILSSRFIVQRFQIKHLSPVSLKDIFPRQKFIRLLSGKRNENVSSDDIRVGDKLKLLKEQIVPADSRLVSESALIDNSLMTGESEAVDLKKWDHLFAGTRCLSDGLKIEVIKKQSNSRINELLNKLNTSLNRDASIVELTDKYSGYFTYGIFGVGLLFFSIYSFVNFTEAVNRVLALFVIACPCAIAITTPIVLRLSAKEAFKNNFLVKKLDVFEKLSRCETVVFDKTGTLTYSNSEVLDWFPSKPEKEDALVLHNLEKNSSHPVAKAVLKSLSIKDPKSLNIELLSEVGGLGIEGYFKKNKYSIQKDKDNNGKVLFLKNDKLVATLIINSSIRSESLTEIEKIKKLSVETYMLTGDSHSKAVDIAEQAGISESHILSNMSPEEKNNFILTLSKKKNVVYVGDGLNDSLAMSNGAGWNFNEPKCGIDVYGFRHSYS